MANKSDYNKIRTNLLKFLPEVYDSEVNQSVFENMFNRFFTKAETKRVAGYVGQGNAKAKVSRRIPEATPHRQAYQLQPLLYNKIGSIEHITSWKDLQSEITRLGIDMSQFDSWGAVQKFNWMPPIDMNKLVNYSDYYWYDPENATSPQYITVRNNCAVATSKLNFIDVLINQFGSTFPIVFTDVPNNIVKVKFNYTALFVNDLTLNIISNNNLTDDTTTILSSSYDSNTNLTTIVIKSGFANPVNGDVFTLTIKRGIAAQDKVCACEHLSGWDSEPFDSTGWDATCGYEPAIQGINQWILQNKWLHKSDVPNFSGAQNAVMPIIEFESDIELNEWNVTTPIWKYRKEQYGPFSTTDKQPSVVELTPITNFNIVSNTIQLSSEYGDLTNFFTPNSIFTGYIGSSTFGGIYPVTHSSYESIIPGDVPTTVLHLNTVDVTTFVTDGVTEIHPYKTSTGDAWIGYGLQWLYAGTSTTTAVNHQNDNKWLNLTSPLISDPNGNYTYQYGLYTQEFNVSTDLVIDTLTLLPQLNTKAMVGWNDIRVYVNGVRSYGSYDETSHTVGNVNYVAGIQFHYVLPKNTVVRIEVGEAAISDFGNTALPVRMIEDDATYDALPLIDKLVYVSLVHYRKNEQVKTDINQYPLFDIYDVFSNTNYTASKIFGFKEDSTATIYGPVGKRIVRDPLTKDFTFEQFLISDSSGLLAYRNYLKHIDTPFWYDPETGIIQHWSGLNWSEKVQQDTHYGVVYTSNITPDPSTVYTGMLWWNTATNTLNVADATLYPTISWAISSDAVMISTYDTILQTIWRPGTNNELYIPRYVDSNRYADGELYTDPVTGITAPVNLPIGSTNGDWEIPDPLYYNNLHENRKDVTLRGLFAHFQSVISSQAAIPALGGNTADGFRMLDTWEVNFGLGGKIKEFNKGFDTFLSSLYSDTVDVRSLISFAYEQYQTTFLTLQDYYTRNALSLLNNFETDHILNPSAYISQSIITQYENNAFLDSIYGDSTTYNRSTNTGVQNVIATLPYLGITNKVKPELLWDPSINLNQIIHHDGHYYDYSLEISVKDNIIKQLLQVNDIRTNAKIGVMGNTVPPNDLNTYNTLFNNSLRTGVYWYNNSTRVLYRLNIVDVGTNPPPVSLPDGTMWFDTTPGLENIKVLQGNTWTLPLSFSVGDQKLYDGTTPETSVVSAWQVFDLDYYFSTTIFEVENRLYDNVPTYNVLTIDLDSYNSNSKFKTYLRQEFFNYAYSQNITAPFSSTGYYVAVDPWTWNYKYSTITDPKSRPIIPTGGDWRDLYQKIYGTPYPHLEPWKIQGYTEEPTWWMSVYGNDNIAVYGTRRWKSLYNISTQTYITVPGNEDMWYNIINGIIPVGKIAPNGTSIGTGLGGQVTGSMFVSVNMTSVNISMGGHVYQPDELLTPFADHTTVKYKIDPNGSNDPNTVNWTTPPVNFNPPYRTLVYDYGSQILSPGADYKFDDLGPVEWFWKNSIYYNYNRLDAAFRLDPVNVLNKIFGIKFTTIDSLQIDSRTQQTFAHNRTIFHGEVIGNVQYLNNGINQWYVNFNRFAGFDTGYSDFRTKWVDWTAPLSYQFNTFLNPDTLYLQQQSIDLTQYDWSLTTKKSPGVYNYWIDAFNIKLLHIPPAIALYSNESEWKFEITNYAPTSRNIQYYGVQEYPFSIDVATNTCSIYSYSIIDVDTITKKFVIASDQTELFPSGAIFKVDLSTGNNGEWTVDSCIFDPTLNATLIYTIESISSTVVDGRIRTNIKAYDIADINISLNMFMFAGNVVESFRPNYVFSIVGSTGNNGNWTVSTSTYDSVLNATLVTVTTDIVSAIPDGSTRIEIRMIPWETGTQLHLSTSKFLPPEIRDDMTYFIIKINNTDFKLADTKSEALANIPLVLSSSGVGTHTIGKLNSKFLALEGRHTNRIWRLYEVDKSYVRTFTPPYDMSGVQNLINIMIGYGEYAFDSGFHINQSKQFIDPANGEIVSWQLELERFIDWAFTVRTANYEVRDRHEITTDYTANTFTFIDALNSPSALSTGTSVTFFSNAAVPFPLSRGIPYYIIRDSVETFRIALTYQNAINNVSVDLIDTAGVDRLYITEKKNSIGTLPSFELNPFRLGIWFSPPQGGIVSNVVTGPFELTKNTHSIFDQYKRPLPSKSIMVLRQDNLTQIQIEDGINNDLLPMNVTVQNPYHWLHVAGANIFVDTYEHIVKFSNYSQGGALIYDPFLGQNTTKFELDFERQVYLTGRPNVGGHYWSEGVLKRNFEMNVTDMRNYYSTYDVQERSDIMKHSRALLGYEGTKNYLDQLNIKPKSQFIFWRGMIQHKGSVNAIKAFINSKHFIDAKVDEFWAYKIGDFGSSYEQRYPEMYLFPTDTLTNENTFQIEGDVTQCNPGYSLNPYDIDCGYSFTENNPTFDPNITTVVVTDPTRWYDQPANKGNVYFDLQPTNSIEVGISVNNATNNTPNSYLPNNSTLPVSVLGNNVGTLGATVERDVILIAGDWTHIFVKDAPFRISTLPAQIFTVHHSVMGVDGNTWIFVNETGLVPNPLTGNITMDDVNITGIVTDIVWGILPGPSLYPGKFTTDTFKPVPLSVITNGSISYPVATITPNGTHLDIVTNDFVIPVTGDITIDPSSIQTIHVSTGAATKAHFKLDGDFVNMFTAGFVFSVASGSYTGSYIVSSSSYDVNTKRTLVYVTTAINPTGTINGIALTGYNTGSDNDSGYNGYIAFKVSGNQTASFGGGVTVTVVGAISELNGTYKTLAAGAFYDPTSLQTIIYVTDPTLSGLGDKYYISNVTTPAIQVQKIIAVVDSEVDTDKFAVLGDQSKIYSAELLINFNGTLNGITYTNVQYKILSNIYNEVDQVTYITIDKTFSTILDATHSQVLSVFSPQPVAGAFYSSIHLDGEYFIHNTGIGYQFSQQINSLVVHNHGTWDYSNSVIMRHNFKADAVQILIRTQPEGTVNTYTAISSGFQVITIGNFIYNADGIRVYNNGILQELGVNYNEVSIIGDLMSSQININANAGDVITVVHIWNKLVENTHYVHINADVIRVDVPRLVEAYSMTIWGYNTNYNALNPAKIIDRKSNVTLKNIQLWDPARNHHYYLANHVIDLHRDTDPATYSNTVINQIPSNAMTTFVNGDNAWNKDHVGVVWWDQSNLDYIPYYDDAVFSSELKSKYWGRLADWSKIKIYKWVETTIAPENWAASATSQASSTLVSSTDNISGTAKQTLAINNASVWSPVIDVIEHFNTLVDGNTVLTTTTFTLNTIKLYTALVTTQAASVLTISGFFIDTLSANMIIQGTGTSGNISLTVAGVTYDKVTNLTTITVVQDLTDTPISSVSYRPLMNTYLNGIKALTNIQAAIDGTFTVQNLKDGDTVTAIQPVLSDTTIITQGIDAGVYTNIFEYTTVTSIVNNVSTITYYYWVEDSTAKGTKLMSPFEAAYQLTNMPAPYMYMQNVLPATTTLPLRQNQFVLRGLHGLVDENRRYVVQLTRDFTLRDRLENGVTPLDLKETHTQWILIREKQLTHIPATLWNRMIEAIIGYTLANSNVRVPAYEYEIYDNLNNTDTRFGLDVGQAFVDGAMALKVVIADLTNPDINFSPTDISLFLQQYNNLATPADQAAALIKIYTSFKSEHVNRIFFAVLHTAFANKTKWKELFKTSYVSLHGIRILETAGKFDD